MDGLISGYRRFRATTWPDRRQIFETLAREGQSPRALVIACSDSRVDPTMIFDAAPGELFVVRNVANLVPPYSPDAAHHATSAALEFAVRVLQVPEIVVLGHAMCGGIRALLEGAPAEASDFLSPWMRIAEPARRRALACDPVDPQTACELETVKLSLENLLTFPWITERMRQGLLSLHGATYGIQSGELRMLAGDGEFHLV